MISNIKIKKFEKILNFEFKNKDNLIKCLIHPSFKKLNIKSKRNTYKNDFERLEFLGDRVLGLVISELIFTNFLDSKEGDLSKKLSYLVKKNFLYKISLRLQISKYLNYSFIKENPGMNETILSDAVESLIGSIFIDSGYKSAFRFIKSIWGDYLYLEEINQQDPKTKLQEISQNRFQVLPLYKLLKKEGPSHSPIFTVILKALNLDAISASGKSKREAERNAAIKALSIFDEK